MSPLVKIRSERDRMSAVERRIADFILENAQLLRDYSSQQLANALGISQSSVVKFTQKLGFRGYPDLKYSVGEAIGRTEEGGSEAMPVTERPGGDPLGAALWQRKARAEEATRLINSAETLHGVVDAIETAGKVFLIGLGEDDLHARGFAVRLSLLGVVAIRHFDVSRMAAQVAMSAPGDLLIVFSEHGKHPALAKIARYFREQRGRVVTVTRHTSNPVRALADIALAVAAHDDASYVQSLIYQSTVQQLLDTIFVHLCEGDEARHARLVQNLDRIQQMLEP
jgi:DNA-binding MurR/RpiR family transcriptional regulator